MSEEPPIQEAPPDQLEIENAYAFMGHALAEARRAQAEAEAKAAAYHYTATHDKLTGLLNRAGLDEALEEFQAAGKKPLVIMADVTNLKALNDKHHHEAGDKLLVGVAGLLRSSVRKDTIVARAGTGSDEFVIVMDANNSRDSYQEGHQREPISPEEIADRVRQRINVSMNLYLSANYDSLHGANVHISTGYGISDDYQTAYRQADKAMYEHKQSQHKHLGSYR